MVSIVTKRFIECFKILIDNGVVRSARQFAFELDYSPQSWNKVLKMERDVTIELVRCAVEKFNLSADYIFCGRGEPVCRTVPEDMSGSEMDDRICENKIAHVPVAAAAGYLTQFHDPVYLEDLNSFSLPGLDFRHGIFRAFDVVGDSMEPGIFQGEILVCSQVDPDLWKYNIRNDFVYVVVTRSEIVVKRIRNQIRENGTLTLISDNSFYQPIDIRVEDVVEMWYVKMKVSPFSHAQFSNQLKYETSLDDLKAVISSQSLTITRLQQTIERTLKNERLKI